MGALVKDRCYVTAENAADAYFSTSAPALNSGPTTFSAWFEKSSGQWMLVRQTVDASGVSLVNSGIAVVPAFPVCDPVEPLSDGVLLGWSLSALIVMAYGVVQIRRLLR